MTFLYVLLVHIQKSYIYADRGTVLGLWRSSRGVGVAQSGL
jgi:hypothetical protein